jgi:hypothetical protein
LFLIVLVSFHFPFLSSLPHRHYRHSSPFRLSQPPRLHASCLPAAAKLPCPFLSQVGRRPLRTPQHFSGRLRSQPFSRSLGPRERLVADIVTSDSSSSAFAFASPSALALSRSP